MQHFSFQPISQLILLNLQIGYSKLKLIRVLTLLLIIPSFIQDDLVLELGYPILKPLIFGSQLLATLLGVVFGGGGELDFIVLGVDFVELSLEGKDTFTVGLLLQAGLGLEF